MRIFVLDDDFDRHLFFRKKFGQENLVQAYTAKEAIDILSSDRDFDIIFLDHDLGNRIFVKCDDENCGTKVAEYLAHQETRARIIIHSLNYWGAMSMKSKLPNAEYIPFIKLSNVF